MKQHSITRNDGRSADALRPLRITYDVYGYATASVLLELGNTKVLCSVSLQQHVPPFLKGKKTGWLNAEYAMLPSATTVRTQREAVAQTRTGRSVEISRLIGRSLRTMVDIQALGERTIVVDCDVLQADGSTRTACITGAAYALTCAVQRWVEQGVLDKSIIIDHVAAVSVGVRNGIPLLDIDFAEDSMIDADVNFVFSRSGSLVEIQGTSERSSVPWASFEAACALARQGVTQLFQACDQYQAPADTRPAIVITQQSEKTPLFSLASRNAAKR